MLKIIVSIAGKPGLYKIVNSGKNMLIVETIDNEKKRVPAYAHDRIISLGDISMYTDAEDVPLVEIMQKVYEVCEGKQCSINYKKASKNQLFDFFAQILPNFDRDRVHTSDIKKLIQWYNILVDYGFTEFKDSPSEEESEKNKEEEE